MLIVKLRQTTADLCYTAEGRWPKRVHHRCVGEADFMSSGSRLQKLSQWKLPSWGR